MIDITRRNGRQMWRAVMSHYSKTQEEKGRRWATQTQCRARLNDARASRLSGCDTCVSIFIHDHGASASLPNCNRRSTSGFAAEHPLHAQLSAVVRSRPSRMARGPQNIWVGPLAGTPSCISRDSETGQLNDNTRTWRSTTRWKKYVMYTLCFGDSAASPLVG